MLLAEEQQYIEEMEAKEETTLERQAKMRERAKFLKEKREQERLKLVQEKLDQRWRLAASELFIGSPYFLFVSSVKFNFHKLRNGYLTTDIYLNNLSIQNSTHLPS